MHERGFTYSEQHRHECEVRYVLAMDTKERRRCYLDAVEARRGRAAAERLRADVRAAWDRRPAPSPPLSEEVSRASGHELTAVEQCERASLETDDGSFLAPLHAGNADPVPGVDNGVST